MQGTEDAPSPGRPGCVYGRHLPYLLAVLLLILSACLVAFAPPGAFTGRRNWGNAEFSSAAWKSVDTLLPDNPRGSMVNDLLCKYELRGMTEVEVRSILGDPDDVSVNNTGRGTERAMTEWEYYLGMYSGFQIDEDILVLTFDARKVVTSWRIRAS